MGLSACPHRRSSSGVLGAEAAPGRGCLGAGASTPWLPSSLTIAHPPRRPNDVGLDPPPPATTSSERLELLHRATSLTFHSATSLLPSCRSRPGFVDPWDLWSSSFRSRPSHAAWSGAGRRGGLRPRLPLACQGLRHLDCDGPTGRSLPEVDPKGRASV